MRGLGFRGGGEKTCCSSLSPAWLPPQLRPKCQRGGTGAASAKQKETNRSDRPSEVRAPLPALVQPGGLTTAKSEGLVLVWDHPRQVGSSELWIPNRRQQARPSGSISVKKPLIRGCLQTNLEICSEGTAIRSAGQAHSTSSPLHPVSKGFWETVTEHIRLPVQVQPRPGFKPHLCSCQEPKAGNSPPFIHYSESERRLVVSDSL